MEIYLVLVQGVFVMGDGVIVQCEVVVVMKIKFDLELVVFIVVQVVFNNKDVIKLVIDFLCKYLDVCEVCVVYVCSLVEQKDFKLVCIQFEILLKEDGEDVIIFFVLGVLLVQIDQLKDVEYYLQCYLQVFLVQFEEDCDFSQVLLLFLCIVEECCDLDLVLCYLDQVEFGIEGYLNIQVCCV